MYHPCMSSTDVKRGRYYYNMRTCSRLLYHTTCLLYVLLCDMLIGILEVRRRYENTVGRHTNLARVGGRCGSRRCRYLRWSRPVRPFPRARRLSSPRCSVLPIVISIAVRTRAAEARRDNQQSVCYGHCDYLCYYCFYYYYCYYYYSLSRSFCLATRFP